MAHQRVFGAVNKDALLTAIGLCRDACVEATRTAPVRGDVYEAVGALMVAIDGVAEVLTGDRRHFWLKSHSNKFGSQVPEQ